MPEGSSIYEVARVAGVSIVTVSRVFNDYPHVSAKMRARVLEAARKVDYAPRVVTKPKSLAVIVGHLDHLAAGDYKTRLILHLVRAAAEAGYLLEFLPFDTLELATKRLVQGIVEVGLTEDELARVQDLPPVPMVVVNKRASNPAWSAVCSDHHQEGYMAARYLLRRGHRKIALILDDVRGWGVECKRNGYLEALREVDARLEPITLSAEILSPTDMVRQLLKARCTACINLSDNYGFAVLDALTNGRGLKIPDDISVIALENHSVSQFLCPRLTTIEQPLDEMARGIINGIVRLLDRRGGKFNLTYESRLVQRDSVSTIA